MDKIRNQSGVKKTWGFRNDYIYMRKFVAISPELQTLENLGSATIQMLNKIGKKRRGF